MIPKEESATGVSRETQSFQNQKEPLLAVTIAVLLGLPFQVCDTDIVNKFTCSILSDTNRSQPRSRAYTVTDSDGKLEMIEDVEIKRILMDHLSQAIAVKVYPGTESNCMPLRKFRQLFPDLCHNSMPKDSALEPAEAQLESYSGDQMYVMG